VLEAELKLMDQLDLLSDKTGHGREESTTRDGGDDQGGTCLGVATKTANTSSQDQGELVCYVVLEIELS